MDWGYNDDVRPLKPPRELEGRLADLLPSLYFIDVRDNCLKALRKPERYVALSYVWGKSNCLRTVKDNLGERLKPGSLQNTDAPLPAVIADAITLTRDIQERYLWVDSLCIVQDDDESKQKAIDKMNIVYGEAVMTIIAASGNDADDGLAGVRPNSRGVSQKFATIGTDLRLIVPHNLTALDRSAWASRAWT
jgi:hypothetical protein